MKSRLVDPLLQVHIIIVKNRLQQTRKQISLQYYTVNVRFRVPTRQVPCNDQPS